MKLMKLSKFSFFIFTLVIGTVTSAHADGNAADRKETWKNSCRNYLYLAITRYGTRVFQSKNDLQSFIVKSCDSLADEAEKNGTIAKTVSPAMNGCATVGDHWKELTKGSDGDAMEFVVHYCSNL